MGPHLYPNFLNDPAEYKAAAEHWRQLWDRIDPVVRSAFEWRHPWLGTGSVLLTDGNPIFTAYSSRLRRGIRIIQDPPTTRGPEFQTWLDSFGNDGKDSESIQELVITCALSDETSAKALALMATWVAGKSAALSSSSLFSAAVPSPESPAREAPPTTGG